jgi:hypothetical protein
MTAKGPTPVTENCEPNFRFGSKAVIGHGRNEAQLAMDVDHAKAGFSPEGDCELTKSGMRLAFDLGYRCFHDLLHEAGRGENGR